MRMIGHDVKRARSDAGEMPGRVIPPFLHDAAHSFSTISPSTISPNRQFRWKVMVVMKYAPAWEKSHPAKRIDLR